MEYVWPVKGLLKWHEMKREMDQRRYENERTCDAQRSPIVVVVVVVVVIIEKSQKATKFISLNR